MEGSKEQDNYVQHVVQVLVPHIPHWGSLKIVSRGTSLEKAFQSLSTFHNVVKLKTVFLDVGIEEALFIMLVTSVPSLRSLVWDSLAESEDIPEATLQIPWSHLVCVQLLWHLHRWHDIACVVQHCISTITTQLRTSASISDLSSLPTTILLP